VTYGLAFPRRPAPRAAGTGRRRLLLVGALLGTAAALALPAGLGRAEAAGLAGVFLVCLVGNATILFPVPAAAAAVAGGAVLDPLAVALSAATGAALGELSGYLAGRGGACTVCRHALYPRVERWMRRYGTLTLLILAAVPNPVFDAAGLAAGAARFPLWRFLAATWAGKLAKFACFAALGAGVLGAS
jgi:uncharacterized membrane protein YdjX (TVP38/TMEM64 family)